MAEEKKEEKKIGITVKKSEDFSEWYTQLLQKAELADVRYNVKGFPVYREWALLSIRKITRKMEQILERKGHLPLHLPLLIPESNFKLEGEHVKGFAPEVFWVTEHGDGVKFDEKLAIKPTGETAFYQMYALWLRSHKDLPYKRYQSGNVYRCEGKATRPFWRTRELLWLETHCAFETSEQAEKQLYEDIETTDEFLGKYLAMPHIFFQRPEWDKFPGADHTYAADALLDSGKVSQLPSTHHLGQGFSKVFGIKIKDKDGNDVYPCLTCYGPCFSRIYGVLIAVHGDDKGLVLPFDIAPVEIVIVPIIFEDSKEKVLSRCKEIEKELKGYNVKIDDRDDFSSGYKFNEWELKGVPVRIEVGPKDLENNSVVVFRRDLSTKETISNDKLKKDVDGIKKTFTKNLLEKQKSKFKDNIVKAKDIIEVKKAILDNKIAMVSWCSMEKNGESCAEVVEKDIQAFVRGTKAGKKEKPRGSCIICGKPAKHVCYIAKSY